MLLAEISAFVLAHFIAVASCLLIAVAFYIFKKINTGKLNFDAPVVGDASDLRAALAEGYKSYPDSPFSLPTAAHPTIILPIRYLDEIKSLPEEKVSFIEEFRDRFWGHYTAFADHAESSTVAHSVKVDLTQSISRSLEIMQPEAKLAFEAEMPRCEDWLTIKIYPVILRIVAKVSGRVMVGAPLCRDENWIRISSTYTRDTFLGGRAMWQTNPLWRPFYALYSVELKKVRQHYVDAANFLRPIFEKRFTAMGRSDFEKPVDMIQWMIDNSGKNASDPVFQGRCQLLISFAALHTTSGLFGNVLLDLAANPQYIAPLRAEVESAVSADGVITKQTLTKLKKMDSFIRESQRMNPLNLVTMNRKMMSDVKLSDGNLLPKGTFIGMAAGSVASDERLWSNPDQFDGFRFEKLRQKAGAENKFQLVTTGKDSLAFGHGSHACPGRFFASNEIKTIFIEFLLKYDIKLKAGTERPANLKSDMSLVVNPMSELMIKERSLV